MKNALFAAFLSLLSFIFAAPVIAQTDNTTLPEAGFIEIKISATDTAVYFHDGFGNFTLAHITANTTAPLVADLQAQIKTLSDQLFWVEAKVLLLDASKVDKKKTPVINVKGSPVIPRSNKAIYSEVYLGGSGMPTQKVRLLKRNVCEGCSITIYPNVSEGGNAIPYNVYLDGKPLEESYSKSITVTKTKGVLALRE